MWRERPLAQPATFIEPCLPRPAKQPPAGRGWIHEIKHDGFRIMARRADGRVQLLTRKGNDFSRRFPQIIAALTVLPVRSCLIDGEAVVCNESGLAVFDLIRIPSGVASLSRAPQHPAHATLHGTVADAVQKLLAKLTVRSYLRVEHPHRPLLVQ
jgi:ATP-dependent DNA ligase